MKIRCGDPTLKGGLGGRCPEGHCARHASVAILYFDLSGVATQADALARIAAVQEEAAAYPPGTVRSLTNVTGSYVDAKVVQALGALAQRNRPYVRVAAVVGAEGQLDAVRQLIAGMSRREFAAFTDPDAAMAWLAAAV